MDTSGTASLSFFTLRRLSKHKTEHKSIVYSFNPRLAADFYSALPCPAKLPPTAHRIQRQISVCSTHPLSEARLHRMMSEHT